MKTKLVTSLILVTGLFLLNCWLHQVLSTADVTEKAVTQIEQKANLQAIGHERIRFLITPAMSIVGFIGVCTIFGKPVRHRQNNLWQSRFLQGGSSAAV